MITTQAGEIPQVATKLNFNDFIGTLKVRWAINRDNYSVKPGIYAVGSPNQTSDVFVTANYKLSFDHLRKNLDGLHAWILVLDTKGVNVWCAAGKGTFGTKELVNRIKLTNLDKIINHKRLILPQLGATGISAHQVKKDTEIVPIHIITTIGNFQAANITLKKEGMEFKSNQGYTVIYGPVRAADIKTFINAGYKATKEMRKVSFTLTDRIKLIPVDFVNGKKYLLIGLAIVLVLSGLNKSGISFQSAFDNGIQAMLNVFMAYVSGVVFTPVLLPYIPARSFALKGCITGLMLSIILMVLQKLGNNTFEVISWFFIICGLSSFEAMNFTGSSTYTSLSGVKKELKVAIPLQITFAVIGLLLFTIGKIV